MTQPLLRALAAVLMSLTAAAPTFAQNAEPEPAPGAEGATAATAEEIESLRREVRLLRELVQALQDQIRAMAAAPPSPPPPASAPAPPREAPPPPAPSAGAPQRAQGLLNPAISAVFQTIGSTSVIRHEEESGFDLSEAEIAFQSVVDPYTRMDLFLAFPAGETPEVEEGFVSTLALPGPLQLKGGRFKSAFGKWNMLHNHQFFTVERPDALDAFFGEESLANDGLSLSVLIPNPWDVYLDAVTEVGTAREGAAFNSDRRRLLWLQRFSAVLTTSPDATLEVGLTAARGWTGPSEALLEALDAGGLSTTLTPRGTLDSAVQGIDLTWKWKPLQRSRYRSFLWQTEALRSHRNVDVLTAGASPALRPGSVSSIGGYTYLETQFTRRWKEGLRIDVTGYPDIETARAWSASAVVRFALSEFQEIRFQVKRIRRNDEAALHQGLDDDDTRVFLEWIPIIGAHGAHKY